jgi:hypothetical protein
MYPNEGGGWNATLLAPGYPDAVYGAIETTLIEYFLVCHGLTNVSLLDPSLAQRYAYPPELVGRDRELMLASPDEIMRGSVDQSAPAGPTATTPHVNDEAGMKAAAMEARACIRANIASAYAAGVYGDDQVMDFFLGRCLPAFTVSMRSMGIKDDFATATLKVLVMQEIAPEAWQKTLGDIRAAAGSR